VKFRVVIPARYASVRLPGKPLRLIAGKPLIEHVHARALASGASEVLVATDDARIASACRAFGAEAVMTRAEHASGSDRIAEVATERRWGPRELVVNLQGDEPLIPPAILAQVATLLESDPAAALATLAAPLNSVAELDDPNVVKVAWGLSGHALYFSRAPIPWQREAATRDSPARLVGAWRHIGLYAYRVDALLALSRLPPTPLEQAERLEQLRALEHGFGIAVAAASAVPGPGVDTEADLELVARQIEANVRD
jgi:3-deoxy-manno-octulosonate cytidylyltransferase (CMP-KDO synthetase)